MLDWLASAGTIVIIVTAWLLFYMVGTLWIFLYRYTILHNWIRRENHSLKGLLNGADQPNFDASLYPCVRQGLSRTLMSACFESAVKESTALLTPLSAIASTAPFVGLFGTIVSILQAFSGFKEGVTLAVVAPAISEALIVTAMGIFVAIPAYWAHLLLKRKAYEVTNAIKIQINILSSGS
ncbi:putative biopolymer transport protein ExbB-like 1 [Campylobacterota bacterium]|nr:putative biopolymer transport protein ExbB-like 1 [Campylobacterota bacterium]